MFQAKQAALQLQKQDSSKALSIYVDSSNDLLKDRSPNWWFSSSGYQPQFRGMILPVSTSQGGAKQFRCAIHGRI